MNKAAFTSIQIVGLVVMVFGAHAVVRQVLDHRDSVWGVLDWVPGGWMCRVVAPAVLAVVGVLMVGWADRRGAELDR